MELKVIDPRALKPNPDSARRTKTNAQADTLLLATIKAVGIVQPPVVIPEIDGGNGYVIEAGHRRTRLAIEAGLKEITVLVADPAEDGGLMRSMVENIAREPINSVDLWRAIERLVAQNWTEEAIGVALALPVRQIRKLRLLANILPAMLDQMAKGDMPGEQDLRTIAAASVDEQKEVWKKYKPSKANPKVAWWQVARALAKTRMFARDASFGDDLREAYGIVWQEDLFAPADQDGRYTTDVEAFLGAQQEWLTNNLPKRGMVAETDAYGSVKLPKKAQRVYGKPTKSDYSAMYVDRDGLVQTVVYRMPELQKPKDKKGSDLEGAAPVISFSRPDVTRKGIELIGAFRTEALHNALSNTPIEDDTLMALLILALAGQNVSVMSPADGGMHSDRRRKGYAAALVKEDGALDYDMDALRVSARLTLIDTLSCRENRTSSGIPAQIAGRAIGADQFLPNMATDEFLSCLSRIALETVCKETSVLPRPKVRDTRAALIGHFKEGSLVHDRARFIPDQGKLAAWLEAGAAIIDEDLAAEEAVQLDENSSVDAEHLEAPSDAADAIIDPDAEPTGDVSDEPDRLAA